MSKLKSGRDVKHMEITKMHGLGNDFIVIKEKVSDPAGLARMLCARRLSVGADGLLLVERSDCADIRMRIINADGSEAEMCGNGIRCFARYVYDAGIVKKPEMEIETLAGIIRPALVMETGRVKAVRVDMGAPSFVPEDIPVRTDDPLGFEVAGQRAACVLMGVPHAMVLVENVEETDIETLGPRIETDPLFPRRTNVNFVELVDRETVRMRTWERGAGRTMACGTGATGVSAMLYKKGLAERAIDVHVQAGALHIENAEDGRCHMTGPADYVFEGKLL